jgi:DNA-binding NtrC family response regulator
MQAKLLRFLENRKYMRVGGATKIDANVRFMFATLRPLEGEVRAGRFRGDLFYRIQGITVNVPPLRERRADIAPLLELFTSQLSSTHEVTPPRFTRRVRQFFLEYEWPGNVRELRNVIETLCLLREGRPVRLSDLPHAVRAGTTAPLEPRAAGTHLTLDLRDGLASMVGQIVEGAISLTGGDHAEAAARLGISRRTVQRYVASGRVSAVRSRTTGPAQVPPRNL